MLICVNPRLTCFILRGLCDLCGKAKCRVNPRLKKAVSFGAEDGIRVKPVSVGQYQKSPCQSVPMLIRVFFVLNLVRLRRVRISAIWICFGFRV